MQSDEQLFTAEQIAKIMQVHIGTVRLWVKNGELPAVWIGKREYRIRKSALDKFIEEREGRKGPD
jgi:excisionase family DNA binding protein